MIFIFQNALFNKNQLVKAYVKESWKHVRSTTRATLWYSHCEKISSKQRWQLYASVPILSIFHYENPKHSMFRSKLRNQQVIMKILFAYDWLISSFWVWSHALTLYRLRCHLPKSWMAENTIFLLEWRHTLIDYKHICNVSRNATRKVKIHFT